MSACCARTGRGDARRHPRRGSRLGWSPLRTAVYRNFWLALLAANIDTWMQTVGAQYVMTWARSAAG
ncbi:hypothetical protein GCE86_14945 [Micromonospora terminaliae]|uniref:MFS transporter n=1 Tax=Micromonospora terminaliae TaxID=1914461 RepID=A0AAJ2ZC65_9ACTN|nr:MFS transporter [Micromonospora terminaliae]NES27015.1 hypothetical protein [Micromonospora terminaliae]QGL48212.1 hypothetical protein GCE86_14945 [Micromonospora terminaliae]